MNIPDYTLVQLCGRGAYGEVWLATSKTGKRVALKYLANSQASKKELTGLVNFSLLPESKHLIRILHMGETEDGFFYTMELADCLYIQGQMVPVTLAQKLKDRKIFSVEETIELGLAMLDGLKILHNAGLIHRDVKPENILYVDGVPKLSDVGLVRSISQTLSVGGTIGFIPPARLTPGNVSSGKPTDDLYALGKVLYCAVTGNKVDDFPSFPAHMIKDPGCRCLNKVILTACDPEGKGFQSADEFVNELKKCPIQKISKKVGSHHFFVSCLIILLLGCAAYSVLFLLQNHAGIFSTSWLKFSSSEKKDAELEMIAQIKNMHDMMAKKQKKEEEQEIKSAKSAERLRLYSEQTDKKVYEILYGNKHEIEKKKTPWVRPFSKDIILYGGMKQFRGLQIDVLNNGTLLYTPKKDDPLHIKTDIYALDNQPRYQKKVYSAKDDRDPLWNTTLTFPLPKGLGCVQGKEGGYLLNYPLPEEFCLKFDIEVTKKFAGGLVIDFAIKADNGQFVNYSSAISIYPNASIVRLMAYQMNDGNVLTFTNRNLDKYLPKDSFTVEIVRTDRILRVYLDDQLMLYIPSYFEGGHFCYESKNIDGWALKNLRLYDIAFEENISADLQYSLPDAKKQ